MTTLNDLTPSFRSIRLLLARERGHPAGERDMGYDILAPLDPDGRLLATEWKSHQTACRVRQFGAGGTDRIGRLRRKPGGQWYFDYAEGERDDEVGFRFGEERFVVGEYVSVRSGGTEHTYQVARVEKP
ncbi:MAG: hypothetical protein IT533_00415 [Hyphomicrobiales bacterium]|jgi:hypothetical protein|nr:hypothetical protein [Hyphomicrobiales bacterium]